MPEERNGKPNLEEFVSRVSHLHYLNLAAFIAASLMLYFLSLRFVKAGAIELFFIVSFTAWPIWLYQREVALFDRRVMLERVVTSQSWIRRWFWAGSFIQILIVFKSVIWASLLLAQVNLFRGAHWFVIAIDLLIFSLLINPISRQVSGHIQSDQQGVVMRRWPLLILNLIFLTVGFLIVDFFLGAPDMRGLGWREVAKQSFGNYVYPSNNTLGGAITGLLATIDAFAWYLAEIFIPHIHTVVAKVLAWLLFLVMSGFSAFLFTRYLLGVASIVEQNSNDDSTIRSESLFSLSFVYTILFLAIPYMWLATSNLNYNEISRDFSDLINPCRTNPNLVNNLKFDLSAKLNSKHKKILVEADRKVDVMLDQILPDVEKGVDAYLDWYFSVHGEYERLGTAVGIDFGNKLTEHLLEKSGFNEKLRIGSKSIDDMISGETVTVGQQFGQAALAEIRTKPCEFNLPATNIQAFTFERDKLHFGVAAGTGAASAIVASKLIAKNVGAKLSAKMAAKIAAKKVAGKAATTVLTGASAGALCGPLAIPCGIVAGVVAWFATDKAMVEIDEYRLRPQMRAELIDWIRGEKLELSKVLKLQNDAKLKAMEKDISAHFDEVFKPYRDGI